MSVRRAALFGVICVMLALGACGSGPSSARPSARPSAPPSTPMIFDENVPAEESVRLGFDNVIQVTSYNGIPVPVKEARSTPLGYVSEWHGVILPAGEIEFVLDIGAIRIDRNYRGHRDIIYKIKNLTLRYTFKPQLHYSLIFNPYGGPDENTAGIEIYLLSNGGGLIKENMLDFFPLRQENQSVIFE